MFTFTAVTLPCLFNRVYNCFSSIYSFRGFLSPIWWGVSSSSSTRGRADSLPVLFHAGLLPIFGVFFFKVNFSGVLFLMANYRFSVVFFFEG